MTKKGWWDRIKRIIRADADLQNMYRNKRGNKMCVIGGLAHEAKVDLPQQDSADNGRKISSSELRGFRKSLLEAYPVLTLRRLKTLQHCNDEIVSTDERRLELIKLCDRFAKRS